jgi:hypothetical protein
MIFRKNTWFASIVAVSCLLASAGLASAQAINVWYGDSQDFGTPGVAQRWANILGNVELSGNGDTLWYTLNGSSENELRLGPDQRRLWADGDFNVEIDFADLAPGANTVEIIHRTAGNQEIARKTVTVNYLTGNDWPQNYFVDWTGAQRAGQGPGRRWIVDDRRQWAALRNDGV